jgi:multidrug efflux pump subunit AcrA (membrane-fusion protein)
MSNGRTIFLHNGTVINPSGMRLQPGMRISVTGPSAGDGNVNANRIDIANNGSNSNFNRNRQYSGVISSVSNGALTMQDGRTVFLHNGTVINPTGTRLRRGMRITVSGSSSGNGNVNAREVDVAYAGNERR